MSPIALNDSTAALLEEMEKVYDISFEPEDIDYCGVYQINKTATISYNPKTVDSASIAHELLHLWISQFNCYIGNHLFLRLKDDKKLRRIFDKRLCDHIQNICDHYKMYPEFIRLGYKPSEFLKDALAEKSSLEEIKKINLQIFGSYNPNAINFYIGSLFSILADDIFENDYTQHHLYLKKLDNELHSIVSEFWDQWKTFEIEHIDPIFNSDIDLVESFIDDMKAWAEGKRIS